MDLVRVIDGIRMKRVVRRRLVLVHDDVRVHHPDVARVLRVGGAVGDLLGWIDDDVVVAAEPDIDARGLDERRLVCLEAEVGVDHDDVCELSLIHI